MTTGANAKTGSGRVTVIGPSIRLPVPITLDAALYDGGFVNGADGVMYTARDGQWRPVALADEAIGLIKAPGEVTVGTGGDFPTIGAALEHLSGFRPFYDESWAVDGVPTFKVRILSGHVVSEQIFMDTLQLSWITIIADDPVVMVAREGLARVGIRADNEHPLFYGLNTEMPQVSGVVFELAASGTIPTDPTWLGGVYTPVPVGASVRSTSRMTVGNRKITGETYNRLGGFIKWSRGARVGNNSSFSTEGATFDDCTASGIRIQLGSRGRLINTNCKRAGSSVGGVSVDSGSDVTFTRSIGGGVNFEVFMSDARRTDGVDSSTDIVCSGGSRIVIGADVRGGQSIPSNVTRPEGIIYRADNLPLVWPGILAPQQYTVGTLPSAATYTNHVIHVSNGDSGAPCLAVSDGTNWLRIPLGAAVASS